MSSMKKLLVSQGATHSGREYPKEAYDYHDDVTKEAVDKVRKKAAPIIEKGDWEVVEGFGRLVSV